MIIVHLLQASRNSSSILNQLKFQLCSCLLTQPLDLPCSALVCTKCIVEWVAATGADNCPCCSDDGSLLSSQIRSAPLQAIPIDLFCSLILYYIRYRNATLQSKQGKRTFPAGIAPLYEDETVSILRSTWIFNYILWAGAAYPTHTVVCGWKLSQQLDHLRYYHIFLNWWLIIDIWCLKANHNSPELANQTLKTNSNTAFLFLSCPVNAHNWNST